MAATVAVGADSYLGWMLDRNALDLEEIATALTDQTDYEHKWWMSLSVTQQESIPVHAW